jgi:hypothetical protein
MPDINGKLQFQDYKNELKLRGFDAYSDTALGTYINFGYRYIAGSFPFSWQEASKDYPVNPGAYQINVASGSPLTPDSIETIVIKTDPYRNKLVPETEERFKNNWLWLDLTAAAARGTTAKYYVYLGNIWLLPPPQVALTYTVFFHQFLLDMSTPIDTPVLPQIFDELILDAALVRCHRRAHEMELANDAQARVQGGIEGLLQDDVFTMEELQERVLPDNQWW